MQKPLFKFKEKKGNITYYEPLTDIKVLALDPKSGKVDWKKVLLYTKHEDLKMYKVTPEDHKSFHVSDDHSLIIWNNDEKKIQIVSPKEILTNLFTLYQLKELFLIKAPNTKTKDVNECEFYNFTIEYDPQVTVGYDFTVEDYYTFATDELFFIQDTIAVYHVINQKAAERIHEVQMFSSADGELQFLPKQDIIYSIYKLSKYNKELLEEELGIEINSLLDKKRLIQYMKENIRKDKQLLDKIKDIGFKYTYEKPTTLSLLDLKVAKEETKKQELTGDYLQDQIIIKEVEKKLRDVFPKADIVKSGARASFTQIRQMTTFRGYVSDFWGRIVPYAIKHSYLEGLTQEEFFYSNYGTRKAVLDTAFNVAESGYLTRRLVYLANAAMLGDHDDCNTNLTIEIKPDEDLAKRLLYRYYFEEDPRYFPSKMKQVTNPKEIVGKTIYLRSPVHCKTERYCKTCYGDLYKIHQSRFVGFIAAQTLGERSTQLTLRTFHTGGVAETRSKEAKKQEDVVSALKQVEKIVDTRSTLHSIEEVHKLVFDLYNLFKPFSSMHLIHVEIIVSEMIYRNREVRWRLTDQTNFEGVEKLSSKIIPAVQSPILGAFFERASANIVKAIKSKNFSILDKLLLNIPLEEDD